LFFGSIGSARAGEILDGFHARCQARLRDYQGATLVYLEGCFDVAGVETPLRIKETETDLLRSGKLASEFIESQYKSPAYPPERCTIYEAGSRTFWLPKYEADVAYYWRRAALATEGVSFGELLAERCPRLDASRLGEVDLASLAAKQLARFPQISYQAGYCLSG